MYVPQLLATISLAHKLTASQGFYAYSYGTAAWLALQAVPLMISPAIINTILSPEVHQLSCKPYPFLHSVIEAQHVTSTRRVLLPFPGNRSAYTCPTMRLADGSLPINNFLF